MTVTFPAPPRDKVLLLAPGGERRSVPMRGATATIRADEVGKHEVKGDDLAYSFAVNALNRDESDLTGCGPGKWGDWLDETSLRVEYRSLSWAVLLVLFGVLTLHLIVASKRS